MKKIDIIYDDNAELECPQEEEWEMRDSWFDAEKCNLDKPAEGPGKFSDGVIVAFASLGLWDGRRNGAKVVGCNVNAILTTGYGDFRKVYADRYNVRSIVTDHDGTDYILFRIARDMEHAERLVERIAYDGMTEKQFRKATRSVRPIVARVYGWAV